MVAALYVLFILNCLFLIMVVLLQAGKGDGMGAVFGGGGSDTIFGNRGAATFLSKLTVGSAFMFMALAIILAYLSSNPASRVGGGFVDPNEVSGRIGETLQTTGEESPEELPGEIQAPTPLELEESVPPQDEIPVPDLTTPPAGGDETGTIGEPVPPQQDMAVEETVPLEPPAGEPSGTPAVNAPEPQAEGAVQPPLEEPAETPAVNAPEPQAEGAVQPPLEESHQAPAEAPPAQSDPANDEVVP